MWSSVLSSRGVRRFYILTASDDYILSLFLCPSLCPGFSPTSAAWEQNPIREKPKWHPTSPLLPLLIPRIFRLFSPAVLPPLLSPVAGPRPGEARRTPRGWRKIIIPGKREEGVIIPTKHPPAAQTEFVGRWALLKFQQYFPRFVGGA